MATTIATLAAKLSLDTGPFAKGMAGGERSMKSFMATSESLRGKLSFLSKAFKGFIAFAAVRGIARSIGDTATKIDDLAKTSQRLGIGIKQLAGLQFAAEQTGAGVKTLNMGLQRMVRRISQAAQGSGEAKDALKELNLDAGRLAGLSPDEQFKQVADALEGVSNQSDKVRLAFKLFDSEGVKLINTMQGGRASIEALQKQAKELGLAPSSEDARKVAEYKDAMGKLSAAWRGLKQQFVIAIAPVLKSFAEGLTSILKALQPVFKAFQPFFDAVAKGFKFISFVVRNFGNLWGQLTRRIDLFFSKIGDKLGIADNEARIKSLRRELKGLQSDLNKDAFETFSKQQQQADQRFNRAITSPTFNVPGKDKFFDGAPAALTRGSIEAFSQARQGGAGILNQMNQHQEDAAMSLREILFEIRRGNSRGLALIPAGF